MWYKQKHVINQRAKTTLHGLYRVKMESFELLTHCFTQMLVQSSRLNMARTNLFKFSIFYYIIVIRTTEIILLVSSKTHLSAKPNGESIIASLAWA